MGYQILEDNVEYGGEGVRLLMLLLFEVTATALGLGDDAPLSVGPEVLTKELLLHLVCQPDLDWTLKASFFGILTHDGGVFFC